MLNLQTKWLLSIFLIGLMSCLKIDADKDIRLEKKNLELAFPLFHSSMNIEELAESVNAETSILIDEEDRITLLYNGAVVEGNSTQVFPPPIGLIDIEIEDTIHTYTMPINYWEDIHTMTMGNTNLEFKFSDAINDKITIHLEIEEMTKNNQPFEIDLIMENGNVISDKISVVDYIVIPTDNSLTIRYTATGENGASLKLDYAAFNFDVFRIKYIEGIFSPRSIDVQGDVISIRILDNWKSGGLTFVDPELYLRVENSFGIQAFSEKNEIEIVTTDGQFLPLESQILETGIDFNYPALNERGEVKVTEIIFDKNNSNLANLFSGKAAKINYDIDALINNQSSNEAGFISEDGYFRIEAVARLPLDLSIDNLILEEKADFDGSTLDDIESGVINWSFKNEFPIAMRAQAYFYNDDNLLDSIFITPPLIEAAEIINARETLASEQVFSVEYNKEMVTSFKQSNSISVISWFDTSDEHETVHILNIYRLHIDAGMLAKFE